MRRGNRPSRWRMIVGVACLVLAVSVPSIAMGATLAPVYRFFKVSNGTHFYTAGEAEANNVIATMGSVYRYEGVAYTLEVDNPQMNAPLYRFFNKANGSHFYTAGEAEKNSVIANLSNVFTYEGPAYNVSLNPAGTTPVYRFFNKANGSHFYTVSEAEKNEVIAKYSATYNFEGPAFYLAYSTTPPPAGDTTPPTTTTDLETVYRGLATIRFFATDNAGGSGVDRTFYDIDDLGAVQGTIAYENSLGLHTVEYWSIDEAGNEETHHFATFTIVSVHSEPDIPECTDCHTGDLMSTHDSVGDPGPGCVACHGAGITPSFDCADCHGPVSDPTTHPNLGTVHDGSAETCTDAACHNNDVSVIHDTMLSNGLTPPGCAACHAEGVTPSTACADCHSGYTTYHPALGADVHKVTGFCYTSGCHVTYGGVQKSDATLLHNTWAKNPGCPACHGEGVEPTLTCFDADCHGAGGMTLEQTHAYQHVDASGDNSGGCTSCHGTDIPTAHEAVGCTCHTATYLNDLMAPLLAAGEAECVDCHTDPMDPGAEHPYHVGSHLAAESAIAANSAGCASCHGSDLMAVASTDGVSYHVPPVDGEQTEHLFCSCHEYQEAEGKTACEDCHQGVYAPHTSVHATVESGIAGTKSSICVSCHGTALYDVGDINSHIADAHSGCSCHAFGEAAGATECVDCHEDTYAPHGFVDGVSHTEEGWDAAGGHDTTAYDVNGGTSHFGEAGVVIKDSMGDTIEQEWPLPTVGVFWSQALAVFPGGVTAPITADFTGSLNPTDSPDVAMGSRTRIDGTVVDLSDDIRTDITWNSVITCYDCHTELVGLVGPQGANAANYGLDPNFPDDWTRAELTSFDPTGMRSIETTQGSANAYYLKWGSRQFWPATSDETTTKALIAGDPTTTATIYAGGVYEATSVTSNGYSAGNVEGAFLCQKCHKLVNSYQGLAIEGNGSGFRSNNLAQIGYGNYPHMEHHGDMITGQGNCVSCHIAIPHGWKRPRLLVYASDPEPYKTQWVYSYYQTKGTALDQPGTANNRNADLGAAITPADFGYGVQTQQGNWGYLGANSLTNPYGTLGATVNVAGTTPVAPTYAGAPNNAGTWPVLLTAHLDGISAGIDSHKEIENPSVEEGWIHEDDFNAQASVQFFGLDMKWSDWIWEEHGTFGGVEWHTDMTPGANGSYNPVPSDNAQHYNNCNGCTSASSNRHTPHNAGINPDVANWE